MSVEIVMPRAGLTMVEGTIGTWNAAEGARVNKGDTIMEYENEKNMIEYEALSSGILHILVLCRHPGPPPRRRLPRYPMPLLPKLRCRAPV